MKKLLPILTILLAFTSLTSLFASYYHEPSIIINGYLPGESSIFQIKHQNSELNLDSGNLLLDESTNFTDNLSTSPFNIYITNTTANIKSYKLNLKTEGFKKIHYDSDGTTALSYGSPLEQIVLDIKFSKSSPDIAGSSFTVEGNELQSIQGISYNLSLAPGSNFDSNKEVFRFYFTWNSSPEDDPVPAGDYLATVTIENITQ